LVTALTSFRWLNYLDPTYLRAIRNLMARVRPSTFAKGLMPVSQISKQPTPLIVTV